MEQTRRKLLILVDTNVGGKGGAETHLWNLLSQIDKEHVAVDVIYFDCDEVDQKNPRPLPRGVNYFRIPVRQLYSPKSLKHYLEIFQVMRRGQYDCVMSLFESADIITGLLAPLAGIKTRISNRRDTGFRSSGKIKLAYKLINAFFTDFIAVSSAVKQSIIDQGVAGEKVKLIYNSVDVTRFTEAQPLTLRKELALPDDAQVFVMVANLNPVKNHTSVIDALGSLHEEYPDAHLVFAGQGQLESELKNQAIAQGLKAHVHFLGARNDVEHVLAAADAFILASHTEGLSNALLEAMASRTPVIATRVGGNTEVVVDQQSGLLVDTDAASIADAMRRLLSSSQLREEFAEAGLARVENVFSMSSMLEAYMSLITKGSSCAQMSAVQATHTQVSDS